MGNDPSFQKNLDKNLKKLLSLNLKTNVKNIRYTRK